MMHKIESIAKCKRRNCHDDSRFRGFPFLVMALVACLLLLPTYCTGATIAYVGEINNAGPSAYATGSQRGTGPDAGATRNGKTTPSEQGIGGRTMMVRYWKIRKPTILLASIAGGATCSSLPSNEDDRTARPRTTEHHANMNATRALTRKVIGRYKIENQWLVLKP